MASEDQAAVVAPGWRLPLVGAAVEYFATGAHYMRWRGAAAELGRPRAPGAALSAVFLGGVCLALGAAANLKLEAVRADGDDMPYDLHLMLLSKDHDLYMDDIDTSKVRWCAEAADLCAVLLSSVAAGLSTRAGSPLREHLMLPWLGAALRGLLLRQAPAAAALLYTVAVVDDDVSPLFAAAFCLLFLVEILFWLEIARLLRSRRFGAWPLHAPSKTHSVAAPGDDVEVLNYVY